MIQLSAQVVRRSSGAVKRYRRLPVVNTSFRSHWPQPQSRMLTTGSQKARARSRRQAGRSAAFDAFAQQAPDPDFGGDDDFMLGDTEAFTFVGNTAPAQPPSPPAELLLVEEDTDEAPFDAPELDDEIFQAPQLHNPAALEPAETKPAAPSEDETLLLTTPSAPASKATVDAADTPAPAPPISIHVTWDRTETAETLIARASMSIAAGLQLRRHVPRRRISS